eukprot:TRINITY_DN13223_c0_g1_i1.p2 TRINITY_DN13223_c0_g1~~TRINITY_DN13223_c0_g1_i1.p2  ORF type:complete len:438 (-),score=96.27 TRINITY_DN13223_c0_g1_i1:1542-2855(-)
MENIWLPGFFLLNLLGMFDQHNAFFAKIGFDVARDSTGVYLHSDMVPNVQTKVIIRNLNLFELVEQCGESYVYSVLRRKKLFLTTSYDDKGFDCNFYRVPDDDYFSLKRFSVISRHRCLLSHVLFAGKCGDIDELKREKLEEDFVSLHTLSSREELSQEQKLHIMIEVGCAVLTLHSEGVSHGAVMLRSIWVSKSNYGNVKLLSFEHSRSLNAQESSDLKEWEADFHVSYSDNNRSRVMEKDVIAFITMTNVFLNLKDPLPVVDKSSAKIGIGDVLRELSIKRLSSVSQSSSETQSSFVCVPQENTTVKEIDKFNAEEFSGLCNDSKLEATEEEWLKVRAKPKQHRGKKTRKSKHESKTSGKKDQMKKDSHYFDSAIEVPNDYLKSTAKDVWKPYDPSSKNSEFQFVDRRDLSPIKPGLTFSAVVMRNSGMTVQPAK